MVPIASDLSYLVAQKRRREGQLGPQVLDSSNQRLYPLPSSLVQREAFAADREVTFSEDEWKRRQVERRQRQLS